MSRKGSLQIDEDLEFQRKEWLAQRFGIGCIAVLVIGAALGFTGLGGPVSHAGAGAPGGPLYIEYDRFVRRGAKATMKLHFHSDPPGFIQFWVSAPYLEEVILDSVAPAPQTVTVEGSRHVYTIRAASPDVTVTVAMEHQTYGVLDAEVGIVGGESVSFRQMSLF